MHGFISNRPISEEYLLCVRHCVKHRICGYVSTLPLCRGKAFLHRFIQKLELLAESGWSELSETVSGVCLGQWKHNELFIFKVSETFFHPFLTQKQSVIQKKISFHNEKTKFFVKLQIQVKSSKHTKKCAADAGG